VRNYVEAKPFEMQRNLFWYIAKPEGKSAQATVTNRQIHQTAGEWQEKRLKDCGVH
jgi:hypothetical protein